MSLIHRWARAWPNDEAPAIEWQDQVVTYGHLRSRIGRACRWLRNQGLRKGDVLGLQLPRSLAFLELHLGALALGIVTLPMNDRYTAREVDWMAADSGATLVLRPPDLARIRLELDSTPRAPLPPATDLESIGVLCYTSGTTGKPKGASIRQRNIAACVDALHEAWAWSHRDVLIHALPMFHVHGLFVAQHGALRAGARAVWLERFEADAVYRAIAEHEGTIFMGVPTYYHRLLQAGASGRRLDSIRLFTSGSAGLPASDWEAWREATGHEIVERYGMTEVGIVVSNPLEGPRRPGSIGRPLPGVRARVVGPDGPCPIGEVGELQIQSRSVFQGYLNRPEATRQALVDGWMRTGDLASQDSDGYLTLVGRRSELVIRGGLNVYPAEVEAVLLTHPAVSEAAVFGVPDDDLGERVHAAVVGDALPDELRAWTAASLARFKVPERVHVVADLPRNAMGKVLKGELRERFTSV